jgi:hypothetical protein
MPGVCAPSWLGWYPADLDDDESIARHRADAPRRKTDHDPAKKWAHWRNCSANVTPRPLGAQPGADLYEYRR